ncbi:MAG: TPM domain-containing protein [Georgfuchsia sp.]
MNIFRVIKHLLVPNWAVRRAFPKATLNAIERAITVSEKQHSGELRFVVEGGLPLYALWQGYTARQRAIDLFSQLRVWDTDENSGILIYVQWVDHAVEILADRGIAAHVPQEEWDVVCRTMEAAFKCSDYCGGALAAIEHAGALLAKHHSSPDGGENELPNKPLML